MATGYLKIKVDTGNQALPVTGATVTVSSPTGETLYSLFLPPETEGLSENLAIETPEVEESLSPDTDRSPYATVNVQVATNGFYTNFYNGVQVFPDTVAIQEAALVPLPEETSRDAGLEFDIPRHALTQPPAPREQVYDTSRVLEEVFIPYNITVHLGPPDAEASNVTVTFPNYIKNVASSEVYPTWPENALRANIHAQISLALNRIYTEWYRSRGYSFDITNSTAYDQYFVRGRDIFENISQLVDEIFNVYITKPNQQYPFYAEYCNGTTVSCPGMSQWGSVSLAEQGYSPQGILEYYYGPIQLITTDDVREISGSYPGSPLTIGSSGNAVRAIQFALNRIALNYPAIPRIEPIDGIFGEDTAAAVRAFQGIFSLTPDGVVGKSTWYRISYIFVAVTKLAELESESFNPIITEGAYPGYPLRIGSTGDSVSQAQYYLSLVDKYYDLVPPLAIDGNFGPQTENATIAFQRLFYLTPDGIIGQNTWNQLLNVFRGIQENVLVPPVVIPLKEYPGYTIRSGANGTDVVYIQLLLRRTSTQFPTVPAINVDGRFGSATEEAVVAFQRLFGLSPDGIVGMMTWNRLNDIYSTISSGCIPTSGAGDEAYPSTPVRQGQSGDNVRYIQNTLNIIRTVFPQIPRLSVDGRFGGQTLSAVQAFQRIAGLTVDGIVGRNTWNRLNDFSTAVSNGCLSDWSPYSDVEALDDTEEAIRSEGQGLPERELFAVYARPARILKIGSFGEDVRNLKTLLQKAAGENPFLMGENMFFGLSTKHAVQRFQRRLGVRADGIVTTELWDKLANAAQ